jgi:predicted transport protein
MTDSKLTKKMLIKAGFRMLAINPPTGYFNRLNPDAQDFELVEESHDPCDVVHLFVKTSKELGQDFPRAFKALKQDGIFWISYPKRSSKIDTDLTRDIGWKVVYDARLRPVTQVSIDDDWSAVRFRVPEHTSDKELIDSQYQGNKAHLKPMYERLVQVSLDFGNDVQLAPRKTYVALQRKKQFAVIKPSTITRVDLGLKLKGVESEGRLQTAGTLGSGSMTHKISISKLEEVDDEVVGWLKLAYEGVA